MKMVNVHASVNEGLCKGCKTCEMVCPVYAIRVSKQEKEFKVEIDPKRCVGCWNCEQRCPEHAVEMKPCEPYVVSTDVTQFDYKEIEALCRNARFHPKQLVCYCTGTRAEELAAAILSGARTPDALVLATGVGAGCGIECNQPILRFLESAGLSFERKKRSFQWYGRTITVWEIPSSLREDFPVFRFGEDQELFDRIINAPVEP
jgi:NAD-dependent dihydropyrimidine dehydrogenase PreA subunit/bacterioferritin-associated ferredoxin